MRLNFLTTGRTLLKFEKSCSDRQSTRRCPVYEECLRSFAAERNGTDPAGERSGSAAAGGSIALGRNGSELRHGETRFGDGREWTAAADPHTGAADGSGAATGARRRLGRYGQAL